MSWSSIPASSTTSRSPRTSIARGSVGSSPVRSSGRRRPTATPTGGPARRPRTPARAISAAATSAAFKRRRHDHHPAALRRKCCACRGERGRLPSAGRSLDHQQIASCRPSDTTATRCAPVKPEAIRVSTRRIVARRQACIASSRVIRSFHADHPRRRRGRGRARARHGEPAAACRTSRAGRSGPRPTRSAPRRR